MDAAGADTELCWPAVRFWLAYMGIGVLAWLIFAVWVPGCQHEGKLRQAKENMHLIQLGLERFAVDSPGSVYPRQIDVLLKTGYLEQMPVNPFSGRPMRCVPLEGEHERGDFSYLARSRDGEYVDAAALPAGDVTSYELVLY
jgi:hypothetical protein